MEREELELTQHMEAEDDIESTGPPALEDIVALEWEEAPPEAFSDEEVEPEVLVSDDDEALLPTDSPWGYNPQAVAPDAGFDRIDDLYFYEHHRIDVDPGQEPIRVDSFLAARIKHLSRSRIKNAAEVGFIRVNDQPIKVSYKVRPLDVISITLPYPPSAELRAENIPLDVVYEDDVLLVVNKPAGLVCHPGSGNYSGTLVNALLYYLQEQLPPGSGLGGNIRPGLVHRIDKDTSGLLLVAKDPVAYDRLAKQFFDRTTDRLYYALVWGQIEEDHGTITGNIDRLPADRKRYYVTDVPGQGKHAVTHFKVIQRYGVATLVQCKLETGRTHQIRVHFKWRGHTLFSDRFYGGHRLLRGKPSRAYQRFIQECFTLLPRQALHAKTLGFVHPTTGEKMFFRAAVPDDIRSLLLRMASFMQVELPDYILDPYTGPAELAPHEAFWA
jgi:23S rRNA pseudouridine1911/1915/1917 synthase